MNATSSSSDPAEPPPDTCTGSDRSLTRPGRARRPPGSRWLVVIFGSLSAFGPLAIDMYLPAFPTIALALGTSIGAVQLTLSVFLVGLAAGQFLWGTLSDRWGRRLPMLLGCAGFVFAAVLCAVTESIVVLIAARFLMGFGGSAGVVVSRAVVRDMFDEHESARFYSLMMIIGGLAPIVAPVLGAALLAWVNWRAIFWVLSGFAMFCFAGVLWGVPETLPRAGRAGGDLHTVARRYLELFRNPHFIGYALATGFAYSMLFAYISGSPVWFIQGFGVSPQRFSLLFMTNAAGIYIMGQLNRLLLKRLSPRRILNRASVLNLAVCLLLAVVAATGVGGFPAFFLLLFVVVASLGWIFPNIIAVAMKPVAHQAGSASALLGVLQFTFGAASASLVGAVADGSAVPAVLIIPASSLCSWLVLVLFDRRTGR
jgi:DHA1 family bicyclomycin/chloramphenicol resistance-like MFS transporter